MCRSTTAALHPEMTDRSGLTTGYAVRHACRDGRWSGPTAGLAPGYAQANLVVLPSEIAREFQRFCRLNSRACPMLEVTGPGDPVPHQLAPTADLRTDLPQYRVWRAGKFCEVTDLRDGWRSDLVSFLTGCSFTFDHVLVSAGIDVRHVMQQVNVPMYRTNVPCRGVGVFRGPLVVSMRPFAREHVEHVCAVTGRYPQFHGAPLHIGDPALLGIEDLDRPDYGDAVELRPGEIPLFWACGVTPQSVLAEARIPFAITHAPGHMFVTDLTDEALLGRGASGDAI